MFFLQFFLRLPIGRLTEEMIPARRSPLVLVVDDDTTANSMLAGILARAGFQTMRAFDAAGAWTGIREQHPDLVLLDVNLPDGSGLDVCRRLQQEPEAARTPVVFISANEDVDSKVRGFEAGGVDYIPKPLAGEEVIARVSTHLRLKQAYESLAELQAERIRRLASAQVTMMPQPASLPEARFCVSLQQVSQAGGDFYDVIPVGGRVVDYLVADASGHDLAASFWTASLKTLLNEYATPINSPRDVLCSINSAMCRILPSGVYFTVLYARLNRQTNRLTLVNAGHPPAVILRQDGAAAASVEQSGDVLGAFEDATFEVSEVKLRKGDRFFLLSDGLIEAHGRREDGMIRLLSACTSHRAQSLEGQLAAMVADLAQDAAVVDDVLLLGVDV